MVSPSEQSTIGFDEHPVVAPAAAARAPVADNVGRDPIPLMIGQNQTFQGSHGKSPCYGSMESAFYTKGNPKSPHELAHPLLGRRHRWRHACIRRGSLDLRTNFLTWRALGQCRYEQPVGIAWNGRIDAEIGQGASSVMAPVEDGNRMLEKVLVEHRGHSG